MKRIPCPRSEKTATRKFQEISKWENLTRELYDILRPRSGKV